MKIAILAIGTELTTGQIINSNASWLAKKFKSFGIETQLHLTVPDDKNLIHQAFEFCTEHADRIFVSGGLGPTSDDFTRTIFSEWSHLPLEWDEASWQHIHDRLLPRGIAVKEIQKQQCYFPRGSRILKNTMGTANGFSVSLSSSTFYFLPGPPREIQAIWESSIEAEIKKQIPSEKIMVTRSWDTIGVGESDIAEKVVGALNRMSQKVLQQHEIGYRVHLPYVEVKLSYPQLRESDFIPALDAIENALAPVTALRNGENIAETLCKNLANFSQAVIEDLIPGGFLTQRIFPFAKDLLKKQNIILSTKMICNREEAKAVPQRPETLLASVDFPDSPMTQTIRLSLTEKQRPESRQDSEPLSELNRFEARALCHVWDSQSWKKFEKTFQSEYSMPLMREREQQFFAEQAMLFWCEIIAKHLGPKML